MPERFVAGRSVRQTFAAQNWRMYAHDQHFLVVGTIEDADAPALGQLPGGAPEKIVLQLRRTRMLEAEHLATLWIDPGHHVLDGAILSGRIHRLEDQQHGMAVRRVQELLQRTQLSYVLVEQLLIVLVRLVSARHLRRPLAQLDFGAFAHAKILWIDLHCHPLTRWRNHRRALGTSAYRLRRPGC